MFRSLAATILSLIGGAAVAAVQASIHLGATGSYGKLPLSFEVNQGQTDAQVQFLSRGAGYTLFLTPTSAVLSLRKPASSQPAASILRMTLVGANPTAKAEGREALPGRDNYFIGSDPVKWHVNIPTFASVCYQGIYEHVDLVYYGTERQLEHDFVVAPGADPDVIRLAFDGARNVATDEAGNLVLETAGGQLQLQKPVIYQLANGVRRNVAGGYALKSSGAVGFDVGAYDHAAPLIIDPVLVYSTYLGGSANDMGYGISLDPSGNAYVTGDTASINFPSVNSNQALTGGEDVFITKMNASGSALVYSTFLGGSTALEHGYDIAVDASGNAYVTGVTNSVDFPTTANALQLTKPNSASQDSAFVAKLDANGALAYSTYLSGISTQFSSRGFGIATDGAGNAYVTGQAGSGFPLTASAFSSTSSNAGFLTRLNTTASGAASLVYSTYLGPTGFAEGRGITVDSAGRAYVTGNTNSTSTNFTSAGAFQTVFGGGTADAFVAKFDTTLSGAASRVYSTYLGGSDQDFGGNASAKGSKAIAIDAAGNTYIIGQTRSTNFPTANAYQAANAGYFDAFLTKLNATGSALIYSTYLGGSNLSDADEGWAVAVNVLGNAYVTGRTQSVDFPTLFPVNTPGSTTGGLFVVKFTPAGNTRVYSTRLGRVIVSTDEAGQGVALDSAGNAFVTGFARTQFPVTVGAFQSLPGAGTDAFVSQIADPTIIGRVTGNSGNPIPGATVNLTGVPSASTTTDVNGYFTFGLLTLGNTYSVAVSAPPYSFDPQTVNNLQKNVRLDFGRLLVFPDFDGDRKADLSFYRAGFWNVIRSSDSSVTQQALGLATDLIVPADYDGDGRTDIAFYRPDNGTWYIVNSSDQTVTSTSFGTGTDVPVPADYDGDGIADVAVFRPVSGTWFIRTSSNDQVVITTLGSNGDTPLIGDFDGDGKSDISYFSPPTSSWGILRSSDSVFSSVLFGVIGDIPVPADYDGDGKTDIAVFRPANGTWYIRNSGAGTVTSTPFGTAGDEPVAADFDGDRKADIAVFRPGTGTWFIRSSGTGAVTPTSFGAAGDQPVPLFFVRQIPDTDGDAIADSADNCTLVANPSQLDANGDGYGNICDADLNNSGLVTTADFGILRSVLNQSASASPTAAAADLNGSGTVTTADYAILRARLNLPPGPSGLHP